MLTRQPPSSSSDVWRLMRVITALVVGFLALALPAATVAAAVLECSGRFPETDVCPGRPNGWPIVVVAGASALLPFVAALVLGVRATSDARATLTMVAAGVAMCGLAIGVETWATGTVP